MQNIQETDQTFVANTYNRFPITIIKGEGSRVFDENGKAYIDMGSGIAVTSFGVADEKWVHAVHTQLQTLQHTSNLYYTEPCAKLAKMLCEKTGMKKVFFGNSGAEANECAIKVARKYAAEKKGADCTEIITLKNSFHGRTLTTLAATGQDVFHTLFRPLTPGFSYIPANDVSALQSAVNKEKTAAIMIECVQGEGGVMPLDKAFVSAIYTIAQKEDILLIVDEVQTGNGRTGTLYAYMQYGIKPDIVTTAKGLGGGLPIGAALLGEKAENILCPGDHGSTFGGNPAVCAGALHILERMDDALLADVQKKSKMVFAALQGARGIEAVSGMGLMIGIKTVRPAGEIVRACMEKGVLCLTAKDKVRLLPALNIPEKLLMQAIDVIKTVCAESA